MGLKSRLELDRVTRSPIAGAGGVVAVGELQLEHVGGIRSPTETGDHRRLGWEVDLGIRKQLEVVAFHPSARDPRIEKQDDGQARAEEEYQAMALNPAHGYA
jgi:hypothetical protein